MDEFAQKKLDYFTRRYGLDMPLEVLAHQSKQTYRKSADPRYQQLTKLLKAMNIGNSWTIKNDDPWYEIVSGSRRWINAVTKRFEDHELYGAQFSMLKDDYRIVITRFN